ncbi:hypothetical protein ABVK25_006431 [Lepraria finkii]|uniref:Uncharacterized protein n=1 Tax=Lepraria finkii TaxID=1340010 RepID=A0ABR4B6F6_9LECA
MSWQGKAEGMGHVEEVGPSGKRGFGPKLKAHLRRFWWLHLIVFIAFTLILVLSLIYAAFPHISQHDINGSTLTIQSLVLSSPTPDSFHLVQTSVIGNGSPYHPNLDAFNASLSLDGRAPYAYIEIPQVHATAQATTVVDQDVSITDLDAFTDYNIAVLQNEDVKLDVKGKTALHEMRFPTNTVNYDKAVTMKGLNKLTGFNVTNFTIELNPEPDGTNMVGTVYIPNPTVMTISMGNVTFDNFIASTTTRIGTTTLTNLTLFPGNNTIPMRSQINQTLVLTQILENFKDGMLPIDIVGNSSVYDGQHLVYFEKALASVTQHITLNVGMALKAVGLDPSSLSGSPP